ncbi:MAG TPA: YccF domain-containing protein [Ruminiclostridium sp.]|nr:YccF domain-containing protein [Ruminiclostridium sp.]
MHTIGNIIWILFGGFISALLWIIAGTLCCVTIVGIPFGIQCFKIASLVFWPFGKEVDIGRFGLGGFIGNILWIILLGWELFLNHFILALLFCITIIGIPFGRQHLKLAKLSILPFGARIYG